MGAFFLAAARDGAALNMSPDARAAIRRCMNERSPAPVTEHASGRHLCYTAGPDAEWCERAGSFVVADGRPHLTVSSAPAWSIVADRWSTGSDLQLPELDGSFALCCFRPSTGDLLLVRDRFGTRPIFWYDRGDCVFAASEAKMLIAAGVPAQIDPSVLSEALRYRWVIGDKHLLSPFHQVPVAHSTLVSPRAAPATRRYWHIPFAPEPFDAGAFERFVDQTHVAMRETIRDVSAGGRRIAVLLSGGVDSSVIAAIAREVVPDCVGYAGRLADSANTELDRSLQVAKHLGMECRVMDIAAPRGEHDILPMVRRLEELPRNPNNLVLAQLFQRIAGEADVVLQGDAAEVMFGLSDSRKVEEFGRKHTYARMLPGNVRRLAGRTLRRLDHDLAQRLARVLDMDPTRFAATLDEIEYSPAVTRTLSADGTEGRDPHLPYHHFDDYDDFDDALQAYQADTFLLSSLVRHDRLAQPHGLQSVSPFLSGRVIDVACRLPRELRYTEFSKPVLRALCDRYFPPFVSRWPKMGFDVPWQEWLAQITARHTKDRAATRLFEEGAGTRLLPPGFLSEAVAAHDMEALWSALSLQLLVETFAIGTPNAA